MSSSKSSKKRKRIIRRCGGGLALLSFILTTNINISSINRDFTFKSNSAKVQNFLANKEQYTFKYLNSLSYKDLVETIKKIKFNNVPRLFEFNSDSYEFFNNRDRVQSIINELYNSGKTYSKDNDKGIPTLVEFLRAGFY
ncbi:MAG: M9 family metallopeptidase N-terminal domain-containing protein, partial [Sarcina sp.]